MTLRSTLKMPNYGCTLYILCTDEFLKECNKVFKKFKSPTRWVSEAEGTLITNDIDEYYLILNQSYLTYNTITHETFHATLKISKDRDIHDEEAQAWLHGYVNEAVFKFLSKKKFTVKHG